MLNFLQRSPLDNTQYSTEKYSMTIKAGIIGGAGYTGGELIRLLIHHPYVQVSFIHSRSHTGEPVHAVHHDLAGETDLKFTGELNTDIDVLFLCVGHGEARQFFDEFSIADTIKLIDLSQDFRLKETSIAGKREFIYGLPELNREQIRNAKNIANPGCFATTILLGLLPLAKFGLLTEVWTTGITGSTGAGQGLSSTSHFSWRSNNIQAYKALTHQHTGEITQSLKQLQPGFPIPAGENGGGGLSFIPWRGDFTRGIFVSSQMNCDKELDMLVNLYKEYYASHPFIHVGRAHV